MGRFLAVPVPARSWVGSLPPFVSSLRDPAPAAQPAEADVLHLRIVRNRRCAIDNDIDTIFGAVRGEMVGLGRHPPQQVRPQRFAVAGHRAFQAQRCRRGHEHRKRQPVADRRSRAGHPLQQQDLGRRYADQLRAEPASVPVVATVGGGLPPAQRPQYPLLEPGPELNDVVPSVEQVVGVHLGHPGSRCAQRFGEATGEHRLAAAGGPVDRDHAYLAGTGRLGPNPAGQVGEAADHGRLGSPGGGPSSINRHSARVSRCSSTRSPIRSRVRSRSAPKSVSPAGTNPWRPASRAASARNARRNSSDSNAPCQSVPKTLPATTPSVPPSGRRIRGASPGSARHTYPWWISYPRTGVPPSPVPTPRASVLSVAKDRKSTRLNSSHVRISYAVFCLKKKKKSICSLHYQKKKKKRKHHRL